MLFLFFFFSLYFRRELIWIPILCDPDLFDQPIELELGAMDFAGFQMLSDPNATMIADPTIEDSFRRDLN